MTKEYYLKHRQERLQAMRKYRKDNKEKIQKYLKDNADKIRKRTAKYRKQHRKERQANNEAWARNNREKHLGYKNKADRSIIGRYAHTKRRALRLAKRGCTGDIITLDQYIRKVMLDSILRPCHYCSGPCNGTGSGLDRKDCTINYTDRNTVVCCARCNRWKSGTISYQETFDYFRPQREIAALRKAGIEV